MFEEIFGVPTHPLVIHAVVVLMPVAAVCAAAVAVVPPLRRRYDVPAAVLAVLAAASVPLAYATGNALYDRRQRNFQPGDGNEASLIEQHKDIANELWPWPVTLAVGAVLLTAVYRLSQRIGPLGRVRLPAGLLASAVTLIGAVGTVVMVVKVGHAGSEAAWEGR